VNSTYHLNDCPPHVKCITAFPCEIWQLKLKLCLCACACVHDAAYCKNPLNDQWYNFDDHHVYKLRQDAVVSKSAYLLFYRRRLAQTRCVMSLQQWVSSTCSTSYSNKPSDNVIQMPDVILHNQSGNISVFRNLDKVRNICSVVKYTFVSFTWAHHDFRTSYIVVCIFGVKVLSQECHSSWLFLV